VISVVIPAWNAAATLGRAVESVLIQELYGGTGGTVRNGAARPAAGGPDAPMLEIIIVDDGSTDSTARVAESLADRNPDLIRIIHQKNSGPAAARNVGIRAARGEYVAFLDADDQWLPGKLSTQLGILEADPELDLVCTAMNGKRFLLRPEQFPLSFRNLLPNNIVYTSSVVVRKGALTAAGGFNEARMCSEDFELWLRIAHRGKIVVLNEPLIRYMKGRGISARLWPMEKGELETYAIMRKEGWISAQRQTTLRWWSLSKYLIRRIRWSI
jgi:glycosyltransferase involved in cell wall biosynthesis